MKLKYLLPAAFLLILAAGTIFFCSPKATKNNVPQNIPVPELANGMSLVFEDTVGIFTSCSPDEDPDEIFKKNGVSLTKDDLSEKKVPYTWSIDYNSMKGDCDFGESEEGFHVFSPDGGFVTLGPEKFVSNMSTVISFEISCHSEETIVKAGVEEYGLLRPGKYYAGEVSGIQDRKQVSFGIGALEHFDSFRPFLEITGDATVHSLCIYQKEIPGSTTVEGEIIERSSLPDPKKSDYPDCRFTAHFKGNVIKSGTACPEEILLVIDGFEDHGILGTDKLKNGDKVLCSILPFEALSDEEQSVQQSDDLDLFALDHYYVAAIHAIDDFSNDNAQFPASGVRFTDGLKEHVSIFDRHINPAVPEKLQQAQQQSISKDLQMINSMLKDYDEAKIKKINSSFSKAWDKEKSEDPAGYNRVEVSNETYVWRNIEDSFFSIKESFSKLISDDAVNEENAEALVELKKALEANGVQLILSVIPSRDPIVARIINKDFRDIVDYQTYNTVRILLEHGIEAVTPSMEAIKRFDEEAFTYNIGGDVHPSVLIQKTVSEILADRLKRYDYPKRLKRDSFTFAETKHQFWGIEPLTHYPANCDIGTHHAGEEIYVKTPLLQEDLSLIDQDSEILVIGNSFSISPYREYGLVSWLDYSLETSVSYYQFKMNGPATVFIDNLLVSPEKYLKGKKVAVIQVAMPILLDEKWHNIAQMDRQLTLLASAKPVSKIPLQQQDLDTILNDEHLSSRRKTTISQLNGFAFGISASDSETKIAHAPIELNGSRGIIVIHACLVSRNVTISVNGVSQRIPSSSDDSVNSYQTLLFELPPDTHDLTITASGKKNSFFVIKDIELWQ